MVNSPPCRAWLKCFLKQEIHLPLGPKGGKTNSPGYVGWLKPLWNRLQVILGQKFCWVFNFYPLPCAPSGTSSVVTWVNDIVCRIWLTLVMDAMKNMANVLRMHLKAKVDFTSRHDVPYSADLATVSKRCFIIYLHWFAPLLPNDIIMSVNNETNRGSVTAMYVYSFTLSSLYANKTCRWETCWWIE